MSVYGGQASADMTFTPPMQGARVLVQASMPMGRKNVSAEYLKDLDDDLGIIKPGASRER